MILGIGSDLTDTRRIESMLVRYGQRFIARIFTAQEQDAANRRSNPALVYAKRFAAKEACAKALGTGIRRGICFVDMEVVNDADGRPHLNLKGGAAQHLAGLTPSGMTAIVHVTLTDEPPLAQAFVVIEALPL